MKKIARVAGVADQDSLRRADMKDMSPSERFSALMEIRDRAFEYRGLKKVYTVRELK